MLIDKSNNNFITVAPGATILLSAVLSFFELDINLILPVSLTFGIAMGYWSFYNEDIRIKALVIEEETKQKAKDDELEDLRNFKEKHKANNE